MAFLSHKECNQAPEFFENTMHINVVENQESGGITRLIIGVGFQVGKFISGVFYGKERDH